MVATIIARVIESICLSYRQGGLDITKYVETRGPVGKTNQCVFTLLPTSLTVQNWPLFIKLAPEALWKRPKKILRIRPEVGGHPCTSLASLRHSLLRLPRSGMEKLSQDH